jgi:Rieske Fe-S protein
MSYQHRCGGRCAAGRATLSRRDLLGASILALGLCCTTDEAPPGSVAIDDTTLTIDLRKAPTLARRGGSVRVVDLDRDINIIVVHPEGRRYAALQRSCTHGGAQVAYTARNETVICTSWGHSEFALDGTVLGGSAKRNLPTYPVRLDGHLLRIGLNRGSV